jgi:hypothetical protein
MIEIKMVFVNNGDGSNSIEWVTDQKVIDRMEELADDGDEGYASGDGLQVRTLRFPESFNLSAWMKENNLRLTTMREMEDMYD